MTWGEGGRPEGAAFEDGRLAAGAERMVGTPTTSVRQHLLRTIRELGFDLRTEQLSVLEAVRGSRLAGVTLVPAKVPVELRIGLEPTESGTRVVVVVLDRLPRRVGRKWGATTAYVEAFSGVLAALDAALSRLDPAAPADFEPWWRDVGSGDVGVLQHASSVAGRASAALGKQAGRLLDGGSADSRRARGRLVSGTGAATLAFVAPEAVAEVPTALADAMLTVGTLVVSRPGAMPPNLVAQVQALVLRVEEQLAADPEAVRLPVSAAEIAVVTFLHQQAALRGLLPVRTLSTCTTCRLERITNPELERMQERTRRARDLVSGLSAVASPFVLAGRLAQMNAKTPQFTCPRCQGTDADETVVTFCQRCGERRGESALRTCPSCQFDFRSLLGPEPLWQPSPATPPAPRPPGPRPPAIKEKHARDSDKSRRVFP